MRFALPLALAAALALQAPARAAEVRPQGYLERGVLEYVDGGVLFVADSERGRRGGRWFRLEGSEMQVFYGLGGNASVDWLWPTHTITPAVWDIVNASPGGLNYMMRYQDDATYTTGFARAGYLAMYGGILAGLGGLTYNLTNPTREMQPVFFGVAGGVALAGILLALGANAAASTNESLLDQALDAYNREMAGRRRRGPMSNPYGAPQQDLRAPGAYPSGN